METLIFDLEETLVDTTKIRPYLRSRSGQSWAEKHINELETSDYGQELKELVNGYARFGKVTVFSKFSYEYAKSLLEKHGYSGSISLLKVSGLPKNEIKKAIRSERETFVIGDRAEDILRAQNAGLASIGVLWGRAESYQLEMAGAERQIVSASGLEEAIKDLKKEGHRPKNFKEGFALFKENSGNRQKCLVHSIGNYRPVPLTDEFSARILDFKLSKQFNIGEIGAGASSDYFSNGRIAKGRVLKNTIVYFFKLARKKAKEKEIFESALFLGMPNSLPEYCYDTDINQLLADGLNQKFNDLKTERIIHQIEPKRSSHLGGRRSRKKSAEQLGIDESKIGLLNSFERVVLIDDVFTTGSSLSAGTMLLGSIGFKGEIGAIVLGRTKRLS